MPIFTFLRRVCKNASSCWSIFCKWRKISLDVHSQRSAHWGPTPRGWTKTHDVIPRHTCISEKEGESRHIQPVTAKPASTQCDWEQPVQTVCYCNTNNTLTSLGGVRVPSTSNRQRMFRSAEKPFSFSMFRFPLSSFAGWRRGGMRLFF